VNVGKVEEKGAGGRWQEKGAGEKTLRTSMFLSFKKIVGRYFSIGVFTG
jgi:hypothetical protein